MVTIPAPKCILLVDNNACIRKIIRAFLEGEAGLKVCGEAVDGYDAIERKN
jgi:chemotaxis response regulator CheB